MEFKTKPGILLVIVGIALLPAISLQDRSKLNHKDCGIVSKQPGIRVIAGQISKRRPWMAMILRPISETNPKFAFSSSGVLITDQWVLTCGHCVENVREKFDKIKILLGEYDRSKNETTEKTFNVSDVRLHQNYSVGLPYLHDIALVKLSKKVSRFTSYIRPICLPPANQREAVGTVCELTGWGAVDAYKLTIPDILQKVEMPVADFQKCNISSNGTLDNKTQMCVGFGKSSNKSSCYGDSGAPYSCKENGKFVIRGTMSQGQDKHCRTVNDTFSVFARVSFYVDWIKEQITKPPPTYPDCEDNHWYCCKFAEEKMCNKTRGLGYFVKYKYCPVICGSPECTDKFY